jgi:hypothetical protein
MIEKEIQYSTSANFFYSKPLINNMNYTYLLVKSRIYLPQSDNVKKLKTMLIFFCE